MKTQSRQIICQIVLVILCSAVTSCDQKPTSIPDKKIVPELKGAKLGDSLKHVMILVYGEHTLDSQKPDEVSGEYQLDVNEDNPISTVGGSNARIHFYFQKGADAETSVLYEIKATFSADSFDAVLKGLTEKYGEGKILGKGKSCFWFLWDGRYSINFLVISGNDGSEIAVLSITDLLIAGDIGKNNDAKRAKKKALDAKDL